MYKDYPLDIYRLVGNLWRSKKTKRVCETTTGISRYKSLEKASKNAVWEINKRNSDKLTRKSSSCSALDKFGEALTCDYRDAIDYDIYVIGKWSAIKIRSYSRRKTFSKCSQKPKIARKFLLRSLASIRNKLK